MSDKGRIVGGKRVKLIRAVGCRRNGLRRGRVKDIKLFGEWGRAGVSGQSERRAIFASSSTS
jgi:hypothetical protein